MYKRYAEYDHAGQPARGITHLHFPATLSNLEVWKQEASASTPWYVLCPMSIYRQSVSAHGGNPD